MKFLKKYKLFELLKSEDEQKLDLNFCNDLFLDIKDNWDLLRVERYPELYRFSRKENFKGNQYKISHAFIPEKNYSRDSCHINIYLVVDKVGNPLSEQDSIKLINDSYPGFLDELDSYKKSVEEYSKLDYKCYSHQKLYTKFC